MLNWKKTIGQKLAKCENLLRLAFKLLEKRCISGIMPFMEMASEALEPITEDFYLFPAAETARLDNAEERLLRFRSIIDEMGLQAAEEMSLILPRLASAGPSNLPVIFKPKLIINMYLADADPCSLPERDNMLVYMAIPFSDSSKTARESDVENLLATEKFYEYILNNAWPEIHEADLLKIESVYMERIIDAYLGAALNCNGAPHLLAYGELGCLTDFLMPQLAIEKKDLQFYESDLANNPRTLLAKLILQLEWLRHAAERAPVNVFWQSFKFFMDYFELVKEYFRRYFNYHWDKPLYQKKFLPLQPRKSLEHVIHKFDAATRLLEETSVPMARDWLALLQELDGNVHKFSGHFLGLQLASTALWTGYDQDICPECPELPLYIDLLASWELMSSGEDWSEFTDIKNLTYFTHVFAHDSHIPLEMLEFVDKISLRFHMSRQTEVSIRKHNA